VYLRLRLRVSPSDAANCRHWCYEMNKSVLWIFNRKHYSPVLECSYCPNKTPGIVQCRNISGKLKSPFPRRTVRHSPLRPAPDSQQLLPTSKSRWKASYLCRRPCDRPHTRQPCSRRPRARRGRRDLWAHRGWVPSRVRRARRGRQVPEARRRARRHRVLRKTTPAKQT
jgi:hypothetical protein